MTTDFEMATDYENISKVKNQVSQNGNEEITLKENGDNEIFQHNTKNYNVENTTADNVDVLKPDLLPREKKTSKVTPTDQLFTTKADGCVKIRDSFGINEEPITVPDLLKQLSQNYRDYSALAYKENDEFKIVTFGEYYAAVRTVAKAFLKLGLERYRSVCILGSNSVEWFYSDLAAIMAGGFAVGIYVTNSPEACLHNIISSAANIVVVENDAQLQKILQIRDRAPCLKSIIQFSGQPKDSSILSWSDVMELGRKEPDEKLDEVIDSLAANECCSILFTSGTTGTPKAVMLSHDNMIYSAKVGCTYLNMQHGCERIMSYLPLSHAAAQICDLYAGLSMACCVYFAEKNILKGALIDNLKSIRPTILFGVPRVWEKVKDGLQAYELTLKGLKLYVANMAKSSARSYHKAQSNGGYVRDSITHRIFRRIFFSKIREGLGLNKCRVLLSGAAPISVEVKNFFTSYDMPICEAFGMSECSGTQIATTLTEMDLLYCGKTVPGLKTKIDKPNENGEGELCIYGRNVFMGYLNDPEKTAEVVDEDGWLHSGDMIICNEKSFIRITGRIKDLLITAGGENIAPTLIELTVTTEIPVVSHAVLVADRRKFVSVLITLKSKVNPDNGMPLDELALEVKDWSKSLGCTCTTVSEILKQKPEAIYEDLQRGIDRVNTKAISAAQRIQKFTILPKDFSLITGELGPTTKLMRRVVYQKYEKEIEEMYAT